MPGGRQAAPARCARVALLGGLGLLASGAMAMPDPADPPAPAADCGAITPGMNIREALAIMRRPPDSTLSGHTAAGPGGDPPAGSYAIDFWHAIGADGRRLTTSIRSSGGVVEEVDCERPDAAPAAPSSERS